MTEILADQVIQPTYEQIVEGIPDKAVHDIVKRAEQDAESLSSAVERIQADEDLTAEAKERKIAEATQRPTRLASLARSNRCTNASAAARRARTSSRYRCPAGARSLTRTSLTHRNSSLFRTNAPCCSPARRRHTRRPACRSTPSGGDKSKLFEKKRRSPYWK